MLEKLWRRFRDSQARHERLKDEDATEKFLREREHAERENAQPVDLLPGRTNTGWAYVDWTP